MSVPTLRKRSYITARCLYDCAFPTKLHRPLLSSNEVRALVETTLREVAKVHAASIHYVEVADDHVRLRFEAPPGLAPLALLTKLKSGAAKALVEKFPNLKKRVSSVWSWQAYLRSVGTSGDGAIDDYLAKTRGINNDAD